jgi:hypothetical protein
VRVGVAVGAAVAGIAVKVGLIVGVGAEVAVAVGIEDGWEGDGGAAGAVEPAHCGGWAQDASNKTIRRGR